MSEESEQAREWSKRAKRAERCRASERSVWCEQMNERRIEAAELKEIDLK